MSSSASGRAVAAGGRPGGAGTARAANGQQAQGSDWRSTLLRSVLMYAAFQAVVGPNGLIKWYMGKQNPVAPAPADANVDPASAQGGASPRVQKPFGQRAGPLPELRVTPGTASQALYANNLPLDVYVFITEGQAPSAEDLASQQSRLVPGGKGARRFTSQLESHPSFTSLASRSLTESLLVKAVTWEPSVKSVDNVLGALRWSGVRLNDTKMQREADLTIPVPEHVQTKNGSIWAEIIISPSGRVPDPRYSLRTRKLLTRLFPERKERVEKKLFDKTSNADSSSDEKDKSFGASALPFLDKEPARLISWWHNNLTLAIVSQDPGVELPVAQLPPPLLQHVHVQENEQGEVFLPVDKKAINYPVVFPNDFWHLREHMHPINTTHHHLPLHVSLYMTSFFKFQLLAAMSDSFEKQPGMAANEVDLIKLTLLENSPWYLGLTVGVSILHSLFEFLAFSSDVSHWRKKDNMAGVSLGSILTNVIVQLIILLYLLDQAQETSWMILASQAVGIVIEAWKLTKAVTVAFVPRKSGEGSKYLAFLPYRLDIRDRHVLSEEERRTQEFDKLAFRIVALVAVPLLGAYTVYSALYQSHRGWWSFFIGTLCSFVYAFGFVSLIPQLIVNYKLKSTAGMNSKTFVYKILGTFVDDLFAFAIRQPWLHRLACFRDDVVFMVFLYQRWIYGVDPTRVNEFGQVLEHKEDKDSSDTKAVENEKLESKKDK